MYDEINVSNLENIKKLTQVCQSVLNKKYDFNQDIDYTKYFDDIRELCLEHGFKAENLRLESDKIIKMDLVPITSRIALVFDVKEENDAEANQ